VPTQPYYIAAPDYDDNVPQIRQLHRLCHLLNRQGCEAYLQGAKKINGNLWTPQLSAELQAAHYVAGRKPIWISVDNHPVEPDLPGKSWRYISELPSPSRTTVGRLVWGRIGDPDTPALEMPLVVPWAHALPPSTTTNPPQRARRLVFADRFLSSGGQLQEAHRTLENLADIGDGSSADPQARQSALSDAELLYCYEPGSIVTEARLCGCVVVYVSNDKTLRTPPRSGWDQWGTAWNDGAESLIQARADIPLFQTAYQQHVQSHASALDDFIAASQAAVNSQALDESWSEHTLDSLGLRVVEPKQRSVQADQAKYKRIQTQFSHWRKRASLREIDGQIYAEHVARGQLPTLTVCLEVNLASLDGLAKTLDSLQQNFLKPTALYILADFACPIDPSELGADCQWVLRPVHGIPKAPHGTEWVIWIEPGAVLQPQALIEFALSMREPGVSLVYSDELFLAPKGPPTPHFKPDLNVEWLRSTNYLGSVIAVRSTLWRQGPAPWSFDQSYALALALSQTPGAIRHIDTVLYESSGQVSTQREVGEMSYLQHHLRDLRTPATVLAHQIAGCRQLIYHSAQRRTVSIIIPTGQQLGYLRCLLESLKTFAAGHYDEVILVTQARHEAGLRTVTEDINLPSSVHVVVTPDGPYRHAEALNAGAQAARSDLLLFADDDTEAIQRDFLPSLVAYFDQPDVACVAPRLVLQMGDSPKLQSGPMVLGIGNWASSYNGEQQLMDEQGVFARLQTSQDVPTVAGHFFLLRREQWASLGGFDTEECHTFTTVHDLCIRLTQRGLRHVWTPISSVLHQGGKTLNALHHDPGASFEIKSNALREREAYLRRWVKHIASDRSYSRHLSLHTAYDVDQDMVVDWMTTRKDRPTAIAFPISSGSGQYRVVEPLNALQQAGLAQTCVVFPLAGHAYRTPNALEITRTAPDRVIVQHSIADAHLQLLRDYRRINPDLYIVQMVDDVFHDLPKTHPLHTLHQREGYVRMREAMGLSDRVIVSTQPLADVYAGFCDDIRVVPNTLDEHAWGHFMREPAPRQRLRLGWAGAGQHLGDLQMMAAVVAHFKDEVDWIFMGMCPDELRPHIKEFHPFVSYVDYPAKLASLDLDIAIAPLEDNLFNRCKSNLRLLEYGAMGWPVVCSDVYPFRTSNPPVLRVANEQQAWIEALEGLLHNPERRRELGRQLNEWVRKDFYVSQNTSKWMSAIFD